MGGKDVGMTNPSVLSALAQAHEDDIRRAVPGRHNVGYPLRMVHCSPGLACTRWLVDVRGCAAAPPFAASSQVAPPSW